MKNYIYKLSFVLITFFLIFISSEGKAMEDNAFSFKFESIEGNPMPLSDYEGKALLVVNTASQCGFTPQYEGLQSVWEEYKDQGLVVIGIPSNNFGSQEPGQEGEVKEFCETTFGINFPMTSKEDVKGDTAHPFYKWLKSEYGKSPKWNFHKYLITPDGALANSFLSLTKPQSNKVKKAIENVLPKNS